MYGRMKIRPGRKFRLVNWDERFVIKSVTGGEVVAQFYRDFTVTVMSLWELLRDLSEGEIEWMPQAGDRNRRQRRLDAAEGRRMLAHWRT